jgi:hypothetical protein
VSLFSPFLACARQTKLEYFNNKKRLTDNVARRRDLLVDQQQAAPLVLGDHALRVGDEVRGDVAGGRRLFFWFLVFSMSFLGGGEGGNSRHSKRKKERKRTPKSEKQKTHPRSNCIPSTT